MSARVSIRKGRKTDILEAKPKLNHTEYVTEDVNIQNGKKYLLPRRPIPCTLAAAYSSVILFGSGSE